MQSLKFLYRRIVSTGKLHTGSLMSAAGKSNPLAISGLVVLTLIWSYSWIFMKQVTSYIGAFDFTALRCIFGDSSSFYYVVAECARRRLNTP